MISEEIKKATKLIKDSSKTMVLTGAGISTESGIPDLEVLALDCGKILILWRPYLLRFYIMILKSFIVKALICF